MFINIKLMQYISSWQGISLLYIVLAAGALWHYLGVFSDIMRIGSSVMPIMLALLVLWDILLQAEQRKEKVLIILWSIYVFIGGMLVEIIGVATGVPFGEYSYGVAMQPQVLGVPLNIGCSWFGVLLASRGLFYTIRPNGFGMSISAAIGTAIAISGFMTLFDIAMEPAAIILQYWQWSTANPPFLNYSAWFICGILFTLPATIMIPSFSQKPRTKLSLHTYLSQVLYFILVLIFL